MSIRIPSIPGKKTEHNWVNVDTVPTIMDMAGVSPLECDGQSALPIVTGAGAAKDREFVIGQYYGKQTWVNPIRTIRTKDWKYNLYTDWGEELYHLAEDPEEITNLAKDPQWTATKHQLKEQLDQWMEDHGDPFYSFTTTKLDHGEARTILK